MKKILFSLTLLTSGCALAMDIEPCDKMINRLEPIILKDIQEENITLKTITDAYSIDMLSIETPSTTRVPHLIKLGVTFYVKQLSTVPSTEHVEIIKNLSMICIQYYFDMLLDNDKKIVGNKLAKAAQQHDAIRENSTLQTIITEFAD